MDRETILQKVADLVSETLEVEADQISEDTLFADLGADSFDLLELVTAFEDEFDLTMDDDSLAQIESVADVIEAIEDAR